MKNQIKLIKEPLSNDYYFNSAKYQFLVIKQGKEGYSIEVNKWINNGLHTEKIDFPQDAMKISECKEAIFYFLLNDAAKKAYNKIFKQLIKAN